ncbi:hypothetical protein [Streptomyces sp. NBC_00102]|uniref:hypothetical protein n=1 Tax=Streptomyces sp. NBC_00102 TaxID=2975652 RepID=UPI0022522513|nr:hypothetical protein [Streptomyces sp. NBC_00102]MCX5401334.1 hypothetical protein [Streptomyces sp. NBC_00102]
MAALALCVVCRLPVSKKKLTTIGGRGPAHRNCRPGSGSGSGPDTSTVTVTRIRVGPKPSRPVAGLPEAPKQKQKQMSRATLLKRIEELRQRDAKKKAQTAKTQPRSRAKTKATPARTGAPTAGSQPYYGVEMKSVDGRWVQMHPESE